jgi:serine/threonine protein kinase, bacterial
MLGWPIHRYELGVCCPVKVLKLAAGSNNEVVLPFTGLGQPAAVAVDSTGAVYVADEGNNRVVTLR